MSCKDELVVIFFFFCLVYKNYSDLSPTSKKQKPRRKSTGNEQSQQGQPHYSGL